MDPQPKEALAIKLLIARRAKNLKQREVAAFIGVHQSHYLRIEKGLIGLTPEQLFKLCHLFTINPNELTEVYIGVAARLDERDRQIGLLNSRLRVAESELLKRDRTIVSLRKNINGFITNGYGIAP